MKNTGPLDSNVIKSASKGPNQIKIPKMTNNEKAMSKTLLRTAFTEVCKGISLKDKIGK